MFSLEDSGIEFRALQYVLVQLPETYLEPYKISIMEVFEK